MGWKKQELYRVFGSIDNVLPNLRAYEEDAQEVATNAQLLLHYKAYATQIQTTLLGFTYASPALSPTPVAVPSPSAFTEDIAAYTATFAPPAQIDSP